MQKMIAPLVLLALLIIPSALQQQTKTVEQKLADIGQYLLNWKAVSPTLAHQEEQGETLKEVVAEGVEVRAQLEQLLVDFTELVKIGQVIQNATSQLLLQCNSSQLLIDLQILKGRQAVSGAVQGGQVFMFVAYLVTIAVLCLVKHCNKHRERVAQSEFELLEAKLQSNKAKRRAAAARAKSAQEGMPRPART